MNILRIFDHILGLAMDLGGLLLAEFAGLPPLLLLDPATVPGAAAVVDDVLDVLVGLGLGNSGGELLRLSDLQFKLSHPVIAVGGSGGLEDVLVSLGGERELVGTLRGGLRSFGLGEG